MKEVILIGPQMTRLINLSTKLNSIERAWKACEKVCRNFLGNEVENYNETVYKLISSYSTMGYNKSLKSSFPAFSFGFFSWKRM
jgi:hypothetical protein